MNTRTPDSFSRLCSLMRGGRVGHIEELLKYNAFSTRNKLQDVGRRARSHQKAPIVFQNFSGEDPHPGAVGNVLDIILTQSLGCCF